MSKNKIMLSHYELDKIYNATKNLYGDGISNSRKMITLIQKGDNGIGTLLSAEFTIEHNDLPGQFTVTITDVEDW